MNLKSICLLATCLSSLAGYAAAQDAAEDNTQVLDTIVVQGTQLSRQLGIEEKRNALTTLEALGVDELGQLPDNNIGESLNRLAGVSMLVEKGEGR